MKKLSIVISAIMISAFTLSACKSGDTGINALFTEQNTEELFSEEMPEPFDFPKPSDPECLGEFKSCYNFTFSNLDSTMMSLANIEEISEWIKEKT